MALKPKRDELLNVILERQHLKLLAVAGTHGKEHHHGYAYLAAEATGRTDWLQCRRQNQLRRHGRNCPRAQYFVYEAMNLTVTSCTLNRTFPS